LKKERKKQTNKETNKEGNKERSRLVKKEKSLNEINLSLILTALSSFQTSFTI
jgi:hypothetical protein